MKSSVRNGVLAVLALAACPRLFAAEPPKEDAKVAPVVTTEAAAPVTERSALPERPFVIRVLKEKEDKLNFANAWHSDLTYLPEPPNFTLLYAHDVPDFGGEGRWLRAVLPRHRPRVLLVHRPRQGRHRLRVAVLS